MDPVRLSKVGEVAKTPEGKTALVNGQGKAYLVPDATVVIWDSFDRKTPAEVAEELAVASGRNPEEFKEPIQELARELESIGLLAPI